MLLIIEVKLCYELRPTIPYDGSLINNRNDHYVLDQRLSVNYEPGKLRSDLPMSWWKLVRTFCNNRYSDYKPARPTPFPKPDLQTARLYRTTLRTLHRQKGSFTFLSLNTIAKIY